MLCVKSAMRFRRPASLTEGFAGGTCVGEEGEGEGEALRLRREPFACFFEEVVVPLAVSLIVGVGVWSCECPAPPVAIRRALSIAMNVTMPLRMPTPSRRLRLGSSMTSLTSRGSSSPRKISGRRWKRVSPNRPPTANATMIVREAGSMFGGHKARRKLGGPEMYAVARRALIAGFADGKSIENSFVVRDVVCGASDFLRSLSALTM